MAEQVCSALNADTIDVVADSGYDAGEKIPACEAAGKTCDFGARAEGRFGKQDSVSVAEEDVYRRSDGERLTYPHTNREDGKTLRHYWTTACQACAQKSKCTTGKQRRIKRWEHEAVLEIAQARLDPSPDKFALNGEPVRATARLIRWRPRSSTAFSAVMCPTARVITHRHARIDRTIRKHRAWEQFLPRTQGIVFRIPIYTPPSVEPSVRVFELAWSLERTRQR
jgi:hypothetical protein